MLNNKRVLFLSPHPDDVEFCCGGTITKLIEQGNIITNIAFSDCSISIPDGFPNDILKMEFMQAMKTAGIHHYELKDIPVRRFNEHRQEVLEYMVTLNKEFNPDIVFFPAANDCHQDHEVIHKEAMRAFKNRCLINYEVLLNSMEYSFNLIVSLDKKHIDKKINIISYYKSQSLRYHSNPEYLISMARVAGTLIHKEFAETFKIIKWID